MVRVRWPWGGAAGGEGGEGAGGVLIPVVFVFVCLYSSGWRGVEGPATHHGQPHDVHQAGDEVGRDEEAHGPVVLGRVANLDRLTLAEGDTGVCGAVGERGACVRKGTVVVVWCGVECE
jgi:hypothetical protein